VSESIAPSSLHVATRNPQDTADLASHFPVANFDHFQTQVSTRVYHGTEPSQARVPFQYGPDFNSQPEDNILSLANNPCHSCGRYDPPSSSTGSLSMEYGVDPYQLQQLLDPNTQYFIDSFIPQPSTSIPPYVSNASSISPASVNSYNDSADIYAEITGSSESHLTLPFPNYDHDSDANNHHSYYM
jgi:hypothetical protein